MVGELGQIVNHVLLFINSPPEVLLKASEETAKFQSWGLGASFPSSVDFACKEYFENKEKEETAGDYKK